jgi:glyceraldehyde 3-phosphate dehydrogenase
MAIKIGINGFGRIGKLVFRAAIADGGFEVVGVNDLMDTKTMAHLLKYDSTHGRFQGTVEAVADGIIVNGKKVFVTSEKDPANIPWGKMGSPIVLESTGIFADDAGLQKHLDAGAKKVLLSVPPKTKADSKVRVCVIGVNDNMLKPTDTMVSNASCTTNALAPIAKVIQDNFGIVKGFMTTIHSYTNDQKILDQFHKDPRRARAGAMNMIPTTTGAAKALGAVIPELTGKLDGVSIRVPTPDASIVDLVVELKMNARAEDVNTAFKKASEGSLNGILEYTEDPIVSSDVIGNPHSTIVDGLMTNMLGGNMLKVFSWYDNEWGYSNRCVDFFKKMAL